MVKLNVAKCNLGNVNLEAILGSSFLSYTRGGPMLLIGAPRGWLTQFLAGSSCKVIAIACCLHSSLCFCFPIPPSLLRHGLASLQIIFFYKPVVCQARDKVLPDIQSVWSDKNIFPHLLKKKKICTANMQHVLHSSNRVVQWNIRLQH